MNNDDIRKLPVDQQVEILFRRNQSLALKLTTIAETVQASLKPYMAQVHDDAVTSTLMKLYLNDDIDADIMAKVQEELHASNPHKKKQEVDPDADQESP